MSTSQPNSDEIIVYAQSSSDMHEKLMEIFKNYILVKSHRDPVYVYDPAPDRQIWIKHDDKRSAIRQLEQIMTDKNIKLKHIDTTGVLRALKKSEVRNCISLVIADTADRTKKIDHIIIKSQRGWIHFRGGAYNFAERVFLTVDEEPKDVYTTIRAPNQFYRIAHDDVVGQELKREVMELIFSPLFSDDALKQHFLNTLARKVAGHNDDSKWIAITGLCDTSKRVIEYLLRQTFGDYIGEFNTDKMSVNNRARWFPVCAFKRIIFATMTQNSKTMDSVGIDQIAKNAYYLYICYNRRKKISVVWNGTMIINSDGIPNMQPTEQFDNCIRYDMIANIDDMTEFCARPDVCNAFFNILMDAYTLEAMPRPASTVIHG